MARQTAIEFNPDGFREILLSDGVKSVVQSATDSIKAKADANISGDSVGFSSNVWRGNYGGGRWIGNVTTTDHESMVAESEDKALTRAVK